MDYRVEDLAAAAGLSVDTLRFYQARQLIPPPERNGRLAIYGEAHREALERIRAWKEQGFTLSQIRALQDPVAPSAKGRVRLLDTLAEQRVGARTLDREELARESGLGLPLVRVAEGAGLLEPLLFDGKERFTETDLAMAQVAGRLLEAGLPFDRMLALARRHHETVQQIAGEAVDLFDEFVRRPGHESAAAPTAPEAYRQLLPAITKLVAIHFQHSLVQRALERLRESEGAEGLEEALKSADSARLEVAWR